MSLAWHMPSCRLKILCPHAYHTNLSVCPIRPLQFVTLPTYVPQSNGPPHMPWCQCLQAYIQPSDTVTNWLESCSGCCTARGLCSDLSRIYNNDYHYMMAPQRGRPYGANLGSMGRNTGTWSIRSDCLSNITSWSRRKGIKNKTLPFIPE